jgi:hypothetical protein
MNRVGRSMEEYEAELKRPITVIHHAHTGRSNEAFEDCYGRPSISVHATDPFVLAKESPTRRNFVAASEHYVVGPVDEQIERWEEHIEEHNGVLQQHDCHVYMEFDVEQGNELQRKELVIPYSTEAKVVEGDEDSRMHFVIGGLDEEQREDHFFDISQEEMYEAARKAATEDSPAYVITSHPKHKTFEIPDHILHDHGERVSNDSLIGGGFGYTTGSHPYENLMSRGMVEKLRGEQTVVDIAEAYEDAVTVPELDAHTPFPVDFEGVGVKAEYEEDRWNEFEEGSFPANWLLDNVQVVSNSWNGMEGGSLHERKGLLHRVGSLVNWGEVVPNPFKQIWPGATTQDEHEAIFQSDLERVSGKKTYLRLNPDRQYPDEDDLLSRLRRVEDTGSILV